MRGEPHPSSLAAEPPRPPPAPHIPAPQKAGLQKRLQELAEQRDAALLEARRWQHAAEEHEAVLVQLQQREEQQLPAAASAAMAAGQAPQGDAVRQLAALQEQLECLAEGGLPALQQERARMSICLQSEQAAGARGGGGGGGREG